METPQRGKSDDTQTTETPHSADVVYHNRDEYFAALQKWIHDAQVWQNSMACMPYFLLSHPELFGIPPLPPASSASSSYAADPSRRPAPGPSPTFAWGAPGAPNRSPANLLGGIRYKVPPYWKRLCAEIVDSGITFILKLIITFVFVHIFKLIDLDKYSIEMLQQNVQSLTYKVALEMTSQLLVLELVNRVVVCLLEAYWLRGGEGGRVGGSTPGKNLFGLRVVLCYHASPIPGQPNEIVAVTPGTDLGWGWSLIRALSKNLFLTLIYPLCFAFFFFKFNRLGYDVLSHSIVVENVDHNNNRR
ncbi:protein FAM8A1 [Thrips palmi]|uniref:Protein FAM8A1 n=1 Tax=Thrips palmi TaxID=161013 RepID=A0A6P8ZTX9_THRPL|nr:protein FAM8A1 [Thrips palmi]XP_034248742.1 protein FAM8A1 [Thrips palmi]